ncbi:hypothetical protein [Gluconobacter japonicus]|uniref:hypothetical protein n=1 Tax=Gluconobacter japonicus TaxID=376620 RepID=UPI0007834D7F|nr:hypothetical protein [Gluconobacter japonicus]KXV20654.1 hypothetical protein AD935_11280 [Gluconobacter japonicus]
MSSTLLNIETALNYVSGAGKNGTVKLGSLTLSGPEVPDALRAGGEQVLVIHRLPGGDKIIDNGGNDPYRLSLTGRFQGTNALTRAQTIDTMRLAAKAVTFSAAGRSWQVLIRSYAYTYAQKGAVIQYELELEIIPSNASTTATGTSALSSLVGSGVTGALKTITGTIADVSSVACSIVGTAQNAIGQITPIANMIGVGGPLAKAQDALTSISGMATTGENLANLPTALSSTITGLQSTVGQLSSTVEQAGANIESLSTGNAASLLAIAGNSQIQVAALEASQSASVALKNAQAVSGQ